MVSPPENVPGSFLDGRRCTYTSQRDQRCSWIPLRFADFANDPLVWVRQRTVHGSQLPESLLNQVHPIKGLLCGTGFLRISVRPGVRSAYVSPNAFAACCFLVRSFPVSGCPADSRRLC